MAKGSALRKPANDTSSDEFAALLDESLGGSTSFEGSVVKGTIVRIANDFVTIDVGLKSEGRVALREFSNGGRRAGGQGRRHRRHLRRPHGKQGRRGRPVARQGAPRGSLDRSREGVQRSGTRHGHHLRPREGWLHRRSLRRRGLPAGQPGRCASGARCRPADGPGPAVRHPQDGPPPRQHRRVAPRRHGRDPRRGPHPPDGRAVRRPGARRRRQEHHRLRRVRRSGRRRRPPACHRHRLEAHQPSVGSPHHRPAGQGAGHPLQPRDAAHLARHEAADERSVGRRRRQVPGRSQAQGPRHQHHRLRRVRRAGAGRRGSGPRLAR